MTKLPNKDGLEDAAPAKNEAKDEVKTIDTVAAPAVPGVTPELNPEPQPTTIYKLVALQDTTFMKFDQNKKLAYTLKVKRGDEIANPKNVIDILASPQRNQFVKTQIGAA